MRKVSIIPRGMALGVTLSTPDTDRVSYSREDLQGKILVALGGRVAEEVVYGTITTGAESDIQQLTTIARQMVGRWGMSDAIGPVAVLPSEAMGSLLPGVNETSGATQELVDDEVRRIVDEGHRTVTELLTEHREQLESLTLALLEARDPRHGRRLRRRGAAGARRGRGATGCPRAGRGGGGAFQDADVARRGAHPSRGNPPGTPARAHGIAGLLRPSDLRYLKWWRVPAGVSSA